MDLLYNYVKGSLSILLQKCYNATQLHANLQDEHECSYAHVRARWHGVRIHMFNAAL